MKEHWSNAVTSVEARVSRETTPPAPSGLAALVRRPRVAIVCPGVDRTLRGYEVQARALFHRLSEDSDIDVTLVKGGGRALPKEVRLPAIHRASPLNVFLCGLLGSDKAMLLEYASFAVALVPYIAWRRPDVVYALDAPIYKALVRMRRLLGWKCAIMTSTGGQLGKVPVDDRSFLQHVTPYYVEAGQRLGFKLKQQFFVPHFLELASIPEPPTQAEKLAVRHRLRLPTDRPIVLSVGSLDITSKRMDYVIREIARLKPEPFLVLLGQRERETDQVEALARSALGPDGFRIATVKHEDIWDYYVAADVFVLASLSEGFGLAYVEALATGLPVIAHDFPVSRYVLGDEGTFCDLSQAGALSKMLRAMLNTSFTMVAAYRRRQFVAARYDWRVLAEEYRQMFITIANT